MIGLPDDRLRSIVERSVNNFNQLPIFTVNGRGSIYSQWPGKYLQSMAGEGDNRNFELSKITRQLKGLARELDTLIVLLSQLSRESVNNFNQLPKDQRYQIAFSGQGIAEI